MTMHHQIRFEYNSTASQNGGKTGNGSPANSELTRALDTRWQSQVLTSPLIYNSNLHFYTFYFITFICLLLKIFNEQERNRQEINNEHTG